MLLLVGRQIFFHIASAFSLFWICDTISSTRTTKDIDRVYHVGLLPESSQ
jgi:hypothetical protein